MMKTDTSTYIKRFSAYRIVEHHVNAIVFAILVITGLSQKFHASAFSQWLIITLGGVDMVRLIHHDAALLFTVLLAVHCFQGAFGIMFRRWQPSMVVNLKDYQDAMVNILYYFNLAEHPARCDRYDYRQKFEYWGVVVGGFLMVATGFILWFPVVSTRFLPGEVIPAAKAAHTNEAMLAFLVIVIWHIYNSIFSPEVYPLDTAIFTGKISRERMLHEHPIELARIEGVSLEELLKQANERHTTVPVAEPQDGHVHP
jgi:formate dehydrogenase subunit gamma